MLNHEPALVVDTSNIHRPECMVINFANKNLLESFDNSNFIDDLYGLSVLHEVNFDPVDAGIMRIEKLLRLL